ncbi:MAG: hypothetical protein YK1312THETA_1090001 [Marine Group I thaumarchaeote]|nr:MAG: hypothetical protein YK1312THETA_1090001 [Marine Group I thaumarchaeote]
MSEENPSTQNPVVVLIHEGISAADSPADAVEGITITPSFIKNCIAFTNSVSEENPSTQNPAVVLIQLGTSALGVGVGVELPDIGISICR